MDNSYSQEYVSIEEYSRRTFYWMFSGLAVTFLVAFATYRTNLIYYIFSIPAVPFILLIAELAVVLILSSRIDRLSISTAQLLFFAYAILNGVVFSTYFVLYTTASLNLVFLITAVFFLVMALYGKFTNTDLSNYRTVLFGGVIALAIFWLLSLFINLSAFERIACMIGAAIFMLMTAYDTQKIKTYHAMFAANPEMAEKSAIFSALQLYLDFINLFIYFLRLFGRRKN